MKQPLVRALLAGLFLLLSPAAQSGDARGGYSKKVLAAFADLSIPADYRERWKRVIRTSFSGMHWNHYILIYVNTEAAAAVYTRHHQEYLRLYGDNDDWFEEDPEELAAGQNDFGSYPVGSVIVKENYATAEKNRPGELHTLSIMRKHEPGFDPARGDWEYLEVEVSQGRVMRGKGSDNLVSHRCGECHASVAERDYVFSTELEPDLMPEEEQAP